MADDRSQSAYDAWRQASEKFDYFITGAAGAICAFVAQSLPSERLGLSPVTLELAALLVLICSVVAGFRRSECANRVYLLGHEAVYRRERARAMAGAVIDADAKGHTRLAEHGAGYVVTLEEGIELAKQDRADADEYDARGTQESKKAMFWYHSRNRLLLFGFMMLVAARVWRPYFY